MSKTDKEYSDLVDALREFAIEMAHSIECESWDDVSRNVKSIDNAAQLLKYLATRHNNNVRELVANDN